MRLARLELYGFKSFADKTEFNFSPGITTLVGPNGCGKSNVVDAVRWVLGEQNPRALRANRMTDLIYSGSETSQQKNYAEVTLVLDNSDKEIPLDYGEVTITRRYYRSEESEYTLNRVPCRLKDISEVLAGTTLGRGTYSIISQGQVAEVINSRPEDRRLMFEEAAGIALYKIRKGDALRKLGNTQVNLTRIEDIIHELQGQEDELRESADKAKVFLSLKEEAKQLEVALWAAKYADLQKRLAELAGRREALAASMRQGEATGNQLKEQLGQTAAGLEECAEVIALLTGNHSQLSAEKTQREYQLELAQQRQRDLSDLVLTARRRQGELNAQLEESRQGMDALELEMDKAEKGVHLYTLAQEQRGAAAALVRRLLAGAENYRGRSEELILQATEAASAYAAGREKTLGLETELALQRQTAEAELGNWQRDLQAIREEIAACAAEETATREKMKGLQGEALQRRDESNLVQRRLDGALGNLAEIQSRITAQENKLNLMQAMDDELQGYGPGARAALRGAAGGRVRGLRGILGELITAAPRFGLAIETALGRALQYVVCDTDAACREAIDYLKKEKAGRATFVPLSAAQNLAPKDRPRKFPVPILGWADELVQSDKVVQPVVSMLLGSVLVTQDLTQASELAKALNYRYKIVTLTGEVISRGLYTGGSALGGGPGPLQRKNAKEEVTRLIAQLKEELVKGQAQVEDLQGEKDLLQSDLNRVLAAMDAEEKELVRIRVQAEQAELRRVQTNEQVQNHQDRLALLDCKLAETRRQLENVVSQLDRDTAGLDNLRGGKESIQNFELELKDLVSLWSSRQNSLQLSVYSWLNQRDNIERQQKTLANQAVGWEREFAQLSQEATNREAQQRQMEANIASARLALTEIGAGLATVAASLDGQTAARNDLQARIKTTNQHLGQVRTEVEQIQVSIHDLEIKETRWQAEAEAMAAQLQELFGLDPEEGVDRLDSRFTAGQLSNKLKDIQERIGELGDVNLAAIRQHQRLQERLLFLAGQKADLVQASQDITGIIAELDATIRTLFLDTFSQVQEHFSRIFKILFDGGGAYLELKDEKDPLESGVEIFARPGGKRSQSLTLLSGGEMSLTAIALLFALQAVRPSPFCILDEIEAALDGTNILRFTQYLRQISRDRQFILITHRRETMEHSDSLYGITLAKEGASQPISVVLQQERQGVAGA